MGFKTNNSFNGCSNGFLFLDRSKDKKLIKLLKEEVEKDREQLRGNHRVPLVLCVLGTLGALVIFLVWRYRFKCFRKAHDERLNFVQVDSVVGENTEEGNQKKT